MVQYNVLWSYTYSITPFLQAYYRKEFLWVIDGAGGTCTAAELLAARNTCMGFFPSPAAAKWMGEGLDGDQDAART